MAVEGFVTVPCLYCQGEDTVDFNLATGEFKCRECENEWDSDEVKAKIGVWVKILAWVQVIPKYRDAKEENITDRQERLPATAKGNLEV